MVASNGSTRDMANSQGGMAPAAVAPHSTHSPETVPPLSAELVAPEPPMLPEVVDIAIDFTTDEGLDLLRRGQALKGTVHFDLLVPHIATQQRPSWCPLATAAAIMNSFGPYNIYTPQWYGKRTYFDQSDVFVLAGTLAPGPATSASDCFGGQSATILKPMKRSWTGPSEDTWTVNLDVEGAYDDYEFYGESRRVNSTKRHAGDWLEENMESIIEPSLDGSRTVLRPNCRGYPNGPDFNLRKWYVNIFSKAEGGPDLKKQLDPSKKNIRTKMWPWNHAEDPELPPPPGTLGFIWGEMLERISSKLVPEPFRHHDHSSGMLKWKDWFDRNVWDIAMVRNDPDRALDFQPGIKVEFVPMFNPERDRVSPHEPITPENSDANSGRGLSEDVWQASHGSVRSGIYNTFGPNPSVNIHDAMKLVKREIKVEGSKAKHKYLAWRERMMHYLRHPCNRVAASYYRPSVRQPGGGHFSPVVAFVEKQVSAADPVDIANEEDIVVYGCQSAPGRLCVMYFLIADVAGYKAPYIWAEASSFYAGMIFPDTDDPLMPSRGTLFIEGPLDCKERPYFKHGTEWVLGGLGYDGRCTDYGQICQVQDDAQSVELSLPAMHKKYGICNYALSCEQLEARSPLGSLIEKLRSIGHLNATKA